MTQPLVTALMPVFNCSEYARGNGRILLTLALDSLLVQSYKNFEILLLDNRSTDLTSEICKQYAKQDSRIHYILDSQQRSIDEAYAFLATSPKGKYCFCVNDDDVYHPEFIHKMVGYLEEHSQVDLVYPNCTLINVDNTTLGNKIISPECAYQEDVSPFAHFCDYAVNRHPIPFVFGMYRSEAFSAIQPTIAFDPWGANVDNILILKFFLRQLRSHFIDEVLFFYRTKDRPLKAEDTPLTRYPKDFPAFDQPVQIWTYFIRHQLYFAQAVLKEISTSKGFHANEKAYMEAVMFDAFIFHSTNLLEWIKKDEIRPDDKINHARLDVLRASIAEKLPNMNQAKEAIRPLEYERMSENAAFVRMRREAVRERLTHMLQIVGECSKMAGPSFALAIELEALLRHEISSFNVNVTEQAHLFHEGPVIKCAGI